MAVPKKKRIGCRIMNRGSQFRSWHLLMVNLTLSTAPLSHLKRLVDVSKASINKRAAASPLFQPLPKFKLRPLALKKRPASLRSSGKEVRLFSTRLLPLQYERKPIKGFNKPIRSFNNLKAGYTPTLWASLIWRSLAKNPVPRQVGYAALTPPPTTLSPQYVKFMSKRFLFLIQIPHKWGRQRGLLLRR